MFQHSSFLAQKKLVFLLQIFMKVNNFICSHILDKYKSALSSVEYHP